MTPAAGGDEAIRLGHHRQRSLNHLHESAHNTIEESNADEKDYSDAGKHREDAQTRSCWDSSWRMGIKHGAIAAGSRQSRFPPRCSAAAQTVLHRVSRPCAT